MSGALECISPLYAFKSVTLRINLSLSYFDEMLSSNLLFPCSANLRATIPCILWTGSVQASMQLSRSQ